MTTLTENSFRFKATNPSLASLSSGSQQILSQRDVCSHLFQIHMQEINTNQEILAQLGSSSSSNNILIKTNMEGVVVGKADIKE